MFKMKNKLFNLFILILIILSFFPIVSALPDLIVNDIDFYRKAPCVQNPSSICSYIQSPEGNTTYLQTGDQITLKVSITNMGDEPLNTTLKIDYYSNGNLISRTENAGFSWGCFEGQSDNITCIPVPSGGYIVQIDPGKTARSIYYTLKPGITLPSDGDYNISVELNPDHAVEEENYTNNERIEFISTNDLPTNNPPLIDVVPIPSFVFVGERVNLQFKYSDGNGINDLRAKQIFIDGELFSETAWTSWYPTIADAGVHNITYFVNDSAGAYAEETRQIEIIHILENNEINAIAIPLYTYFDLNDNAPFNLSLDSSTYIGATFPAITFDADRYTEDEMVGDEYMDENADLTEEQSADLLEIIYGSTSDPFYCSGPEYMLPIKPTSSQRYNATMLEYFCFLENICNWISTGNPECSDQYAAQIYDSSPKTNPSIPYISSQTFSVIVRDANNDAITVKWYLDDELNETDQFNSGLDGGKADFTVVGSESLIGNHTIKVEVADEYDTPDADFFNFETKHNWDLEIYGATGDLCIIDDDCDDGDNETYEYCGYDGIFNICYYDQPYTLYGHVMDMQTGENLANKEISIYDASIYNPFNDAGNYSALLPKGIPNAITHNNGFWYANLPNGLYHFLVSGSKEDEFNAVVNISKGKEKRDAELNENIPVTNFNAEGHVLYSGTHNNNNKYVWGDKVKFTMFGVNNGETNETITFNVQDHSSIGGPTAPMVYYGDINDTDESLTILAGNKSHKTFYWKIPIGLDYGKYDIHVVWDNETWHKIGNFFIEEDTTNPGVYIQTINGVSTESIDKASVHVNENLTIQYKAWENPQDGTMTYYYASAGMGVPDEDINVSVDKEPDAEMDITGLYGGSWMNFTTSFNESGNYQMEVIATDLSGNIATSIINVNVFVTEEEANAIAIPWYNAFNFNDTFGIFLMENYDLDLGRMYFSLNADRYAEAPEEQIGDEYLTPGNNDSLLDSQIQECYEVTYGAFGSANTCQGPEYFEPIYGTTLEGYNYTLLNFFCFYSMVCESGASPERSGICNTMNFAPQIYDYLPKDYSAVISSSGSKTYQIITRDANKDPINATWYVDDEIVEVDEFSAGEGGSASFVFTGYPVRQLAYKVEVIVEDPAHTEDLDEYNWQKYRKWIVWVQ